MIHPMKTGGTALCIARMAVCARGCRDDINLTDSDLAARNCRLDRLLASFEDALGMAYLSPQVSEVAARTASASVPLACGIVAVEPTWEYDSRQSIAQKPRPWLRGRRTGVKEAEGWPHLRMMAAPLSAPVRSAYRWVLTVRDPEARFLSAVEEHFRTVRTIVNGATLSPSHSWYHTHSRDRYALPPAPEGYSRRGSEPAVPSLEALIARATNRSLTVTPGSLSRDDSLYARVMLYNSHTQHLAGGYHAALLRGEAAAFACAGAFLSAALRALSQFHVILDLSGRDMFDHSVLIAMHELGIDAGVVFGDRHDVYTRSRGADERESRETRLRYTQAHRRVVKDANTCDTAVVKEAHRRIMEHAVRLRSEHRWSEASLVHSGGLQLR